MLVGRLQQQQPILHSSQHRLILELYMGAGLKKFLKKNAEGDTLAVLDSKLGSIIKEKLDIPCIFRCTYTQSSAPHACCLSLQQGCLC